MKKYNAKLELKSTLLEDGKMMIRPALVATRIMMIRAVQAAAVLGVMVTGSVWAGHTPMPDTTTTVGLAAEPGMALNGFLGGSGDVVPNCSEFPTGLGIQEPCAINPATAFSESSVGARRRGLEGAE